MPTTTQAVRRRSAVPRPAANRCAPAWPACPTPPSSASIRAAPGWPNGWPPTSACSSRLGFIDVSFYRDDYAKKGLHPDVKPTHIGFNVDGATILLVDDVLYTGRTTRAAINVLFDYGRPARIMLAALADRGGRELPVAADFVAATRHARRRSSRWRWRAAPTAQLTLTIEEDNA